MTLEEIKKGLDFMDTAWEKMSDEDKKRLAYTVIDGYRTSCKELLRMVEEKGEQK